MRLEYFQMVDRIAAIDPAAGSESGNIGNLNPKSALTKKAGA